MENVRKGKGIEAEHEEILRNGNIPDWYIESCKKIKYMFPKAHATAYVMMAFRIAYFKVYHPLEFYAASFTVRADEFDADMICKGKIILKNKIDEINGLGNKSSAREKNILTIVELAFEMLLRGYEFRKVDLQKSHSTKFLIEDNALIPPLVALDGVGESAANAIVQAREKAQFSSIEDLQIRAKASKTVIEALAKHGALNDIPEKEQLALFS
jgi:DNA polymerase-3 subunit alpha (Gram-positive type)